MKSSVEFLRASPTMFTAIAAVQKKKISTFLRIYSFTNNFWEAVWFFDLLKIGNERSLRIDSYQPARTEQADMGVDAVTFALIPAFYRI